MPTSTDSKNQPIELHPGFRCLGVHIDSLGAHHFVLRLEGVAGSRNVLLPFRDVVSDSSSKAALAAHGYLHSQTGAAVERLRQMAEENRKLPLLIVADGNGWYDNGRAYLFGSVLIGRPRKEIVVLTSSDHGKSESDTGPSLASAGTLKKWRKGTRRAMERSDLLLCSICFALAAPLLSQLGEKSWLAHFYGPAGSGKTLVLVVARSLFGNPGTLPNWNTTPTAFDEALKAASDAPFSCDELTYLDKQSDAAKNLSRITYSVDANRGKAVSKRSSSYDGAALRRGRTVVLSNGEISLARVYAQTNQTRREGEQRRAFDIAIDSNPETGMFRSLPAGQSFREFSKELASTCSKNYGHPGHHFVSHLVSSRKVWPTRVREAAERFAKRVDSSGHHLAHEQAVRFGIALAAGLEARRCGIIKCSEIRIDRVLRRFYRRSTRILAKQDVSTSKLLKMLRHTLRKKEGVLPFAKAKEKMPPGTCAYYRKDRDEFLVWPNFLEELCGKSQAAMRMLLGDLKERGHLRPGPNGVSTKQVSGINGRRERFVCIKGSFASKRGSGTAASAVEQ